MIFGGPKRIMPIKSKNISFTWNYRVVTTAYDIFRLDTFLKVYCENLSAISVIVVKVFLEVYLVVVRIKNENCKKSTKYKAHIGKPK